MNVSNPNFVTRTSQHLESNGSSFMDIKWNKKAYTTRNSAISSLFNRACHFVLFVHAFRKELEGRYKLDSPELKEMLARECARNEASHKEELKRHQIK